MKKICFWLIMLLEAVSLQAQKLTVSQMTAVDSDNSATQNQVKDLNGDPCALVKILLPIDGVSFEGNVIGEPQYNQGEYWVYMTNGSKELRIKLSQFQPCHIIFSEYGVQRLKARVTYHLTLNIPKKEDDQGSNGQHYLVLTVTPANSMVSIDGQLQAVGKDGKVNICLSQGEHTYRIEAPGFDPEQQTIVIGSETVARSVRLQPSKGIQSETVETFTVNGVSFNMIHVESGSFTMGATPEQGDEAKTDENPTQETLRSYRIGETEVTQALWKAVMDSNPSVHQGDNLPVENVTWDECEVFLWQLNELTGKKFRLPTMAEWEYAARGGNKSKGYKYSGSNNVDDVAWYTANSNGQSHTIKAKHPNELGLYDMSGNVGEWCEDRYVDLSRIYRRCRDGSWKKEATRCRVSARDMEKENYRSSDLGLRLAH